MYIDVSTFPVSCFIIPVSRFLYYILFIQNQNHGKMECLTNLEHLTFARPTTLYHDLIHMITTLLKRYDWKKFAVMYEKGHTWVSVYKSLQHETQNNMTGMEITHSQSFDDDKSDMESFLDSLKWKARGECFHLN